MIVVVADTSPLNYLILIGEVHILRALYTSIVIPPEVKAELTADGAPAEAVAWMRTPPSWLHLRAARERLADRTLDHIDPGERAAIRLAEEEKDVLLLIDDAAGREEANRRNIPTTGTLGVLRAAAVRQLLHLPTALTRLSATSFRVSPSLIKQLLEEDDRRTRKADPPRS
jgi:predicted nucleic acid-binding protein